MTKPSQSMHPDLLGCDKIALYAIMAYTASFIAFTVFVGHVARHKVIDIFIYLLISCVYFQQ